MITLHFLEHSRAGRVVWLLEELGVPYELVRYPRGADLRAPATLRAVHPLGKSPVIVDGDLTLAESATVLRYIDRTYGGGRLSPDAGTAAYWQHEEWLDYAEGSLAGALIGVLIARFTGGEAPAPAQAQLAAQLAYLDRHLTGRTFLVGDALSLADIQIGYLTALMEMGGLLESHPAIAAYWAGLQQVPSFQTALAKAGPMALPRR